MTNAYIVVIGSVNARHYKQIRWDLQREGEKPIIRRIHASEIPIKYIQEGDNCTDVDPFDFELLREFFGDPEVGVHKQRMYENLAEKEKLARQLGKYLAQEHGFSIDDVANVIVRVGRGSNLLPSYPLDDDDSILISDLRSIFGIDVEVTLV